jgi:hypothetical protein
MGATELMLLLLGWTRLGQHTVYTSIVSPEGRSTFQRPDSQTVIGSILVGNSLKFRMLREGLTIYSEGGRSLRQLRPRCLTAI